MLSFQIFYTASLPPPPPSPTYPLLSQPLLSSDFTVMDKTPNNNSILSDCGSSLYDSFELNSFKRQLDSAIAARSFSMPHISDRLHPPAQQMLPGRSPTTKKPFKISRSINKFIKSVFRLKPSAGATMQTRLHFLDTYQLYGKLTTIPEVSEKCIESPEIDPLVRKTASERFTSSTAAAAAAAIAATAAVSTVEVPCT